MSDGRVYLVGAGPGDPGLLTLRGRDLLARAEVVVYDRLSPPRLLELAPPEAERVFVGKRAGDHALDQAGINRLLIEHALAGRTVVRLKGGDPMVFGRGGEEALALAEAGVAFEVVPGVTAAVAAAACAGIPLTHRGLASAAALVTGHEADDKADSEIDWDALARFRGTLAFYMGMANLEQLCANLKAHGLDPATPAAVVHWGATPRQRVVSGTVETVAAEAEAGGIRPPALLYVGPTVALREQIAWFERRLLFGRQIVVTRPGRQAGGLVERLESLGAEVVEAPAIRIEPAADRGPLLKAVRDLDGFDWVILTSVNAVEALFAALAEAGLDARALAPCRMAVMGSATGERLRGFGVRADLVPPTFTSRALLEAMAASAELRGRRVLCPRADIAPRDLVEDLASHGAKVQEVAAYRTVADNAGAGEVAQRLAEGRIDWLTFTSGSTVRQFLSAVAAERVRASRARIASIGPTTSAVLRESGLRPAVEADPHTIDGLVEAIAREERAAQP